MTLRRTLFKLSKAIKPNLDVSNPDAWFHAGAAAVRSNVHVDVEGTEYTPQQCFLKALDLAPKDPTMWSAVTGTIPAGGSLTIHGSTHTAVECMVRAIELSIEKKEEPMWMWYNLGRTLSSGSRDGVYIGGVMYSALDCVVKSVESDDKHLNSWGSLGMMLSQPQYADTVSVRGVEVNAVDCCVKALQIDPRIAKLWYNLGVAMNSTSRSSAVSIGGKEYTSARDCLVKTLELDPTYYHAWLGVGAGLNQGESVRINGVDYSALECIVQALDRDDGSNGARTCYMFEKLGQKLCVLDTDSVVVAGTEYTARDCFVKVLEGGGGSSCSDPNAWFCLGITFQNNFAAVRVCGREVHNYDCFMRVVELNPTSYLGWCNLGASLLGLSDSSGYNSKECFLKALELNPNFAPAWHYLGITFQCPEPVVRVGGKAYTEIDCCVRALELDPQQVVAWRYLVDNFDRLAPSTFITIGGVAYSLEDCKRNGYPTTL